MLLSTRIYMNPNLNIYLIMIKQWLKTTILESVCICFFLKISILEKLTLKTSFVAEGYSKWTIYGILQRFSTGISYHRRKGQGRIAKKMPKRRIKALSAYFDHKHGKSQRQAASTFNISASYVCKLLKTDKDFYSLQKKN